MNFYELDKIVNLILIKMNEIDIATYKRPMSKEEVDGFNYGRKLLSDLLEEIKSIRDKK